MDLYIEDWKENGLQQYEESLKLIKTEMESVEERAEEGTQTLIFTNSQGIEIKKYYRAVEVEGTSRFFQNEKYKCNNRNAQQHACQSKQSAANYHCGNYPEG